MDRQTLDGITPTIIQAAIEVHKRLGPGLFESVLPVHLGQVRTYLQVTEKRVVRKF